MSINFFDYFGYYLRINFSKPCLFPPSLGQNHFTETLSWWMWHTVVFRWQWVLCETQVLLFRRTSSLHNAFTTKVSCAINTDLTKRLELVWREGLWGQTLAGSSPGFPTCQLYDPGQIMNLAVFAFPLRRSVSQKAVARLGRVNVCNKFLASYLATS